MAIWFPRKHRFIFFARVTECGSNLVMWYWGSFFSVAFRGNEWMCIYLHTVREWCLIYGSFRLHGRGTGTGNRKNGLLYIMLYCSHCTGNGNGTRNGKLYNGLWTHFSLFPYLICVLVMLSNHILPLCPRCNVNSTPHSCSQSCSRSPSPFSAVWTSHYTFIGWGSRLFTHVED